MARSKENGSSHIGKQYGRWTVIEYAGRKGSNDRFLCRCSCDAKTEREVPLANLLSGRSQSCGCLRRQRMSKPMDENKEYPPEQIQSAHDALVRGGGMAGVVYRRVLGRIKSLRQENEALKSQLDDCRPHE